MATKATIALLATIGITTGAVYTVHRAQTQDRERMHRLVKREIEEERRRKECSDNGGPCVVKPPSVVMANETDDERRKRECAEAGGPCVIKPPSTILVKETDDDRRKRECAESGGPCAIKISRTIQN